jgi:hypothetical protein
MDQHQEFDCLVAIWGFIAEEYARTRDPKLLAEMDDIETRCNQMRDRIYTQSPSWPSHHQRQITAAGVYLRGRS